VTAGVVTTTNDLTDSLIADLIDLPQVIDACQQAFEGVGRGEILNPAREQTLAVRDGLDYFGLDMPAEWPGHCRSRKIIEEYSDVAAGRLARREAYLRFDDLATGTSLRLDAGLITDMRTGAAGALGVKYLASRTIERVAILGTGRVCRHLALAADQVFALKQIRCTSRSEANRQTFAAAVEPQLRTSLSMTDSIDACVKEVDAVLMAVPTPEPIIDVNQLRGVDTIAVIAGDSRTRQVSQPVLCGRPVVVDHYEQAQVSGEFLQAREQATEHRIALVRDSAGEVMTMADAACGRIAATGGTIYLTGMAAQDLCTAARVVENWMATQ
jgi:ornithine cyclodeaminase/alanine dehydrogenase-like protein (mu-crystallin family)